ncbi:MAG: hypothetical protein HY517_00665 [Candidatus Aenigmarchaeota archaeon]|nr:hypothetical protein [Candidatus Aenigmarchaeota archaeon]
MKIKETLMSQSLTASTNDPYLFSLHVMEELSKSVKVIEKKNSYETDGPHHRSTVVFDAIDLVDDFSKIVFRFNLLGEGGVVRAGVSGSLSLSIEDTGFFSQMFTDYYVKNVFPLLRKISEEKVAFFGEKIDALFAANN